MLKQLQMGMRAFLLMASRVWTCICFLLKKQVRAVSRCFAPLFAPSSAVRHESYYGPSNRRLADPFPHSVLLSRYRYHWQIVDVTLPESVIRPLPCECSFAISFETKRDETYENYLKNYFTKLTIFLHIHTHFSIFFSIDFTRLCKSYILWKMIFILFTKRTQFSHVLLLLRTNLLNYNFEIRDHVYTYACSTSCSFEKYLSHYVWLVSVFKMQVRGVSSYLMLSYLIFIWLHFNYLRNTR